MSEFKNSAISLLPEGAAWNPKPGADMDKLLDAVGGVEQSLFDDFVLLAKLRDPELTPILDDLEREYGIYPDESLSDETRRSQLKAVVYARRSTGSIDYLQQRLDDAGFELQVHSNSPAVDPNTFLSGTAQMQAGETLAQAGEPTAQAGVFEGQLVVNTATDDDFTDVDAFALPDLGPWPIFYETFGNERSVTSKGGTVAGGNQTTGPVGNWPMLASTHDPGNNRTLDVTVGANHAIFSATAPTKTITRHGYSLNGTSNYFTIANATSIIPNGDVSNVSMFVSFVRGPTVASAWWVQRGQAGGRTNMSLMAFDGTTIGYSGGTGADDIQYVTGNIAGQFHTLGYTYEKGSQVLYYDGLSVATKVNTTVYNIANPAMDFGRLTTGGGYMDGEMSHVVIFNRTLSPGEMRDLHDNAVAGYNAA